MGMSASELIRNGLADPVRLFVKQEPHTLKKLNERRFRLISSVSLVDQIIERLLFGPQNQLEIALWPSIPSKPGMGLSLRSQYEILWSDLRLKDATAPACEADISGFDWSIQEWELWADLSIRVDRCLDMHDGLRRLMVNRFRCFMLSCFQLSDGTLLEQAVPGLMKSGSYCTSSTNSRIRCLMGHIIGTPWIIAMGDDSVEAYVPNAPVKYAQLGHTCKQYDLCESGKDGLRKVNFCSHQMTKNNFWLTSWPKTLFKFLDSPNETVEDLERELFSCPRWGEIKQYLCQIGLISDKTERKEIIGDGPQTFDQNPTPTNDQIHHACAGGYGSHRPKGQIQETPASEEEWTKCYSNGAYGWSCDIQTTPTIDKWANGHQHVQVGNSFGCSDLGYDPLLSHRGFSHPQHV